MAFISSSTKHTEQQLNSEHSVAFMGRGVCDDVGALDRGPLPGARAAEVEGHFLRYESVQVHIVQSIPPAPCIRAAADVSRRAGSA